MFCEMFNQKFGTTTLSGTDKETLSVWKCLVKSMQLSVYSKWGETQGKGRKDRHSMKW